MLQYQTLDPGTLHLLKELQAIPALKQTRLVGGTSLALQLGHRKSVDLDLFGYVPASSLEILESIHDGHTLQIIQDSKNIHVFQLDGVKVDIVNYRYGWIDSPINEDGISLATPKDIAAMKIAAIIGRGTKKDFIDLYFLLRCFPLQKILDFYLEKYPDGSLFIALKSLTYFEDAEQDPMPFMLQEVEWPSVKETIKNCVVSYDL